MLHVKSLVARDQARLALDCEASREHSLSRSCFHEAFILAKSRSTRLCSMEARENGSGHLLSLTRRKSGEALFVTFASFHRPIEGQAGVDILESFALLVGWFLDAFAFSGGGSFFLC